MPWRSSSCSATALARAPGGSLHVPAQRSGSPGTNARQAGRRHRESQVAVEPRCAVRSGIRVKARSGPSVSLVTSPAQTRSQRASMTGCISPPPAAAVDLSEEAGASCGEMVCGSSSWISPGGVSTVGGSKSRLRLVAVEERYPAVAGAERPHADPDELAGRHHEIELGGVVVHPLGEHVALRGSRREGHAPGGPASPREAGRCRAVLPIPCHAGRKMPSRSVSTASISLRSAARDRRRSRRSTSRSTHSMPGPARLIGAGRDAPFAVRDGAAPRRPPPRADRGRWRSDAR